MKPFVRIEIMRLSGSAITLPAGDHRVEVFNHPQSNARTLFLLEAAALLPSNS